MRRLVVTLTALGSVLAACSDAGGVDPDVIAGPELAAVRRALDSALAGDTLLSSDTTLYPTIAALVFPYIDRASRVTAAGDTTRVVGIEMDIRVAVDTADSLIADFTMLLGWNGFDSTSRTVDSVFFIVGAGRAPANDSLRTHFAIDSPGTGTGLVIHQAIDSTLTIWLARAGHLRTTASTYGAGRIQSAGGLSWTTYRGMLNGDVAITAKLVPDSTTTVSSTKDFGSGARALKVRIRGRLPRATAPTP
ncbi:MAG TPA: hypothetical protein VGQ06_05200 [Gemmatimonadales bacterium]|jgi:hypothetical protein|nr:hypothetical protein [Gemmatimonadales bacterium]